MIMMTMIQAWAHKLFVHGRMEAEPGSHFFDGRIVIIIIIIDWIVMIDQMVKIIMIDHNIFDYHCHYDWHTKLLSLSIIMINSITIIIRVRNLWTVFYTAETTIMFVMIIILINIAMNMIRIMIFLQKAMYVINIIMQQSSY